MVKRKPQGRTGERPALAWLAAAQLAIGAAAIFARLALAATGPFAVGALRLGIAAIPVVALALLRGSYRRLDAVTEWRLVIAGVLLALHYAAWFASLQHASVAASTLIVCSSPIVTEAWTIVRTRTFRPLTILSIALALAGVAIVVGVPSRTDTPLGVALAICGMLLVSAYLLLVKASDPRYTTLAVIGRTYPVAALVLGAGTWLIGEPIPPIHAAVAWSGILALAFVSQLFGGTVLVAAIRHLSVTFVATTVLLEPVIAAIAASIVFTERLPPLTAAGALLILIAVGMAIRAEAPPFAGAPT